MRAQLCCASSGMATASMPSSSVNHTHRSSLESIVSECSPSLPVDVDIAQVPLVLKCNPSPIASSAECESRASCPSIACIPVLCPGIDLSAGVNVEVEGIPACATPAAPSVKGKNHKKNQNKKNNKKLHQPHIIVTSSSVSQITSSFATSSLFPPTLVQYDASLVEGNVVLPESLPSDDCAYDGIFNKTMPTQAVGIDFVCQSSGVSPFDALPFPSPSSASSDSLKVASSSPSLLPSVPPPKSHINSRKNRKKKINKRKQYLNTQVSIELTEKLKASLKAEYDEAMRKRALNPPDREQESEDLLRQVLLMELGSIEGFEDYFRPKPAIESEEDDWFSADDNQFSAEEFVEEDVGDLMEAGSDQDELGYEP
jgi:hypothetical protein